MNLVSFSLINLARSRSANTDWDLAAAGELGPGSSVYSFSFPAPRLFLPLS
jgi:hypothetical protein